MGIIQKRKAAIVMVLGLLLGFGGNVQAYVLKTNGENGTKWILFAGEKTDLVEIK